MSKIADKHGLTNKYRSIGTGKRFVKRGRPRTRLLGGHTTKSKVSNTMSATEAKIVAVTIASIAGIALCWFAPIFIPVFAGVILLGGGDVVLKKIWNLPKGKWSAPASIGWTIITSIEMIISFFMGIFILTGELPGYALMIDVIVYCLLSILILIGRYKRLMKKRKGQGD